MAYATGTGANGLDFLDALRSFASGLGWTINKWDTTNRLLYLSKDLCRLALEYSNSNVTVWNGTTSSVVSEGRLRGTLCQSFVTGVYWYASPGSAIVGTTAGRDNGPTLFVGNMQGPFTQWFLFSNATGDYIHAIIQTSADMYTYMGFGNGDKGGMTHSGVAYAFSEGGRYWYQEMSATQPPSYVSGYYFNKASRGAMFFGSSGLRFNCACYQVYTENALPAGFVNSQAIPSFGSASYSRTTARALTMQNAVNGNGSLNNPANYPANDTTGSCLLDNSLVMTAPGFSSYVPMLGVPLIVSNTALTLYCAIGSVPDIRLINLSTLSPQQELALGADTWKVFPMMRQTSWSDAILNYAPSTGQYGLALKKIV